MNYRWKLWKVTLTLELHPQLGITSKSGIQQRGTEPVFHFQILNPLLYLRGQRFVGCNSVDPRCFASPFRYFNGPQHGAVVWRCSENQVRVPRNKADK